MAPYVRLVFDAARHRRHRRRNWRQTVLLLGAMLAILGLVAWLLAGPDGVVWALAGGTALLLLAPQVSPRLILRLYGAREIPPGAFPEAYRILDALVRRAGLSAVPRLHYIPSSAPTAFAVGGRDNAALALTDGLLRRLDGRELAGVLAHEVSHIRHNDLRIMALADVVSRIAGMMSTLALVLLMLSVPLWLTGGMAVPWLLLGLLTIAPTVLGLLQLALSRAREFDADADAAALTGDPAGLASALEKLERTGGGLWERLWSPRRPAVEPSVLRTHPPTEERIRRLLDLVATEEWVPVRLPVRLVVPGIYPAVDARPRRRVTGVWY